MKFTRFSRLFRLLPAMTAALAWQAALADPPSEASVKAGFIFNFAKFIEWPASTLPSGAPLLLCSTGHSAVQERLDLLQGRQAQGHEIRVRDDVHANELRGCHILYISPSEEKHLSTLLDSLGNRPVLAVSDIADFAESGGIIGLDVEDNRVVFTVNLTNARGRGLKPSAQMLRLGRVLQ